MEYKKLVFVLFFLLAGNSLSAHFPYRSPIRLIQKNRINRYRSGIKCRYIKPERILRVRLFTNSKMRSRRCTLDSIKNYRRARRSRCISSRCALSFTHRA